MFVFTLKGVRQVFACVPFAHFSDQKAKPMEPEKGDHHGGKSHKKAHHGTDPGAIGNEVSNPFLAKPRNEQTARALGQELLFPQRISKKVR